MCHCLEYFTNAMQWALHPPYALQEGTSILSTDYQCAQTRGSLVHITNSTTERIRLDNFIWQLNVITTSKVVFHF